LYKEKDTKYKELEIKYNELEENNLLADNIEEGTGGVVDEIQSNYDQCIIERDKLTSNILS
jgi:hypothetical protein